MNRKQVRKKAVNQIKTSNMDAAIIQFFSKTTDIVERKLTQGFVKNLQIMIDTLQGTENMKNMAYLTTCYSHIKLIINALNLSDEEKGYLWYFFLQNNFALINSKPYCYVEIERYADECNQIGYTIEEFKMAIYNFLIDEKMNQEETKLTLREHFIKKVLLQEEQNRLQEVKNYIQIRDCFNHYSPENMEILKKILEEYGLGQQDIELLKKYLESEEKSRKKENSPKPIVNYNVTPQKSNPTSSCLNKKEEKKYFHEMYQIMKKVSESNETISIEEYVQYIKAALKVGIDFSKLEEQLTVLFSHLTLEVQTYHFFYDKASFLTSVDENLEPLLKEISSLFFEIMPTPDDEVYEMGKRMILENFSEIQRRIKNNFSFEQKRILKCPDSDPSNKMP